MDGKFWAQCLENNRYVTNGDTINNNNKHNKYLLTIAMSGTGLSTLHV